MNGGQTNIMNIMDYVNKDKLLYDLLLEKLNNWIKQHCDNGTIDKWNRGCISIKDIKQRPVNGEILLNGHQHYSYEIHSCITLINEMNSKIK
jgi:hypothetical protein